MATFFTRSPEGTATLSAPALQPATADPRFCQRLPDTHGQAWVSLLWGHCSFLPGPGAQGSVCALQESVSSVWCKFWWLYGGVYGDLLQKGLCHTQVCCIGNILAISCCIVNNPKTQFLKTTNICYLIDFVGQKSLLNVCFQAFHKLAIKVLAGTLVFSENSVGGGATPKLTQILAGRTQFPHIHLDPGLWFLADCSQSAPSVLCQKDISMR